MKKIIGLSIYTLVIVGLSFLFRNATWLANALYIATVIVAIAIIAILNPGIGNLKNSSRFLEQKKNEKQLQQMLEQQFADNKDKIEGMHWHMILFYLYLLVPFFIAISLFVRS